MGVSRKIYTLTVPDASYLDVWMKVESVPRLREVTEYSEWALSPLEHLDGWHLVNEAGKELLLDDVYDNDTSSMETHLATLLPTEDPGSIAEAVANYVDGLFYRLKEEETSVWFEDNIAAFLHLSAGSQICYLPAHYSSDWDIYELQDDYKLERYRQIIMNPPGSSALYEIWMNLVYINVTEESYPTWETTESYVNYHMSTLYNPVMIRVERFSDASGDYTAYIYEWDARFWSAIGSRRLTYVATEPYYTHHVDAALLPVVGWASAGGLYSAYLDADWEGTTIHPDTMGSPWAGDIEDRPYNPDLYDWTSQNLNPPGIVDEHHDFLISGKNRMTWLGSGEKPPAMSGAGGGPLPIGGILGVTIALVSGLLVPSWSWEYIINDSQEVEFAGNQTLFRSL